MLLWNRMQYCLNNFSSKVQNYLYNQQQYKCENHPNIIMHVMSHFAEVQLIKRCDFFVKLFIEMAVYRHDL